MLKTLLDIKEKSKTLMSFSCKIRSNKQSEQLKQFLNEYYHNINLDNNNLYIKLFFENHDKNYTLPKCPYCNKEVNVYTNIIKSTCGDKECIQKQIKDSNIRKYGVEYYAQTKECHDKMKKTSLERYGVENYSKTKECKEKIKQTSIERYGVENYNQSKEAKEKFKKLSNIRYGTDNPFQAKEVKEKIKQTNLKRYGVEYTAQSQEIREKIKQTNLEKHGVERYAQTDEFKEYMKKHNIQKFGVEHVNQNKEIKEKIQQTNLERYGAKYYSCLPECQTKVKNTTKEKYGSEYYTQTDEYKKRVKQTNLEKYGSEYYIQTDDYKEKSKQTNLEKYGSEYYTQSNEFKEKIKQINLKKRINKINNIIKDNNLTITIKDNKCICGKCGKEFQTDDRLIQERFRSFPNTVCPYCFPKGEKNTSQGEQELLTFIKELLPNENVFNRYHLNTSNISYELDVFIPSKNIAFEFNGLYWHSELYKDKYYHRDKSKLASEKGIRLIHIWEDDWLYKQEIVKSRIRNLLGKTKKRVYARQTTIKEISYQDCKQFLDENHIQGCGVGNIRYGLFYKDDLVSVIQIDSNGQLSRFANKLNTNVIGGFSKLFKYCEKYIKYTFIDLDCSSENNIYNKYMKFDSYVEPTWYLILEDKRIHRRNFQKKKLLQMGLGSPEQTEHEITLNNKLYRIYNSGNIKYVR